jgi:GNAT superfamily N-acetyltransferase
VSLTLPASTGLALLPARAEDFEDLLALRLRAMRESLERLGRYDEQRARERLAESFDPAHTHHILHLAAGEAGGEGGGEGEAAARVGFMVLKITPHALRLNHLYLDTAWQRRGIGHRLLQWICAEADRQQVPVELMALKQSAANRFYLRHGFVAIGEGEWDIDYVRQPLWPSVRTVRDMWHAFQARDWDAAQRLMRTDMQAHWWTSGERFETAAAFVEAQRRYPEGWSIRLIECERLEDGRVMSLVRVDHAPAVYYATSFFKVDDGLIIGIDEYWATAEAPPAWRNPPAIPGLVRFDPIDDPRAVTP